MNQKNIANASETDLGPLIRFLVVFRDHGTLNLFGSKSLHFYYETINMGLSSNILWHQTGEKGFYEILKSRRLRYSYCLERIIPEFRLKPIAFPMISVSNYPFSEISNNKWAYGNYCIGFKQEWGVKAGFSPVTYCSYGSRGLQMLNLLLHDALKNDKQSRFGIVMYLFAQMKFVQAPLVTKLKTFKNYRFYDEREWRVVPYITETDNSELWPFYDEKGYKEFKKNNNDSPLLEIGVDFQYEDIHYIIVEKDDDVQKTKDIVGDRIHIFTKAEIMEDVIGVDHHDEILPSQEQMDHEAAQRHVARMRRMVTEALGKFRENGKK